jgi:hypothetical protein
MSKAVAAVAAIVVVVAAVAGGLYFLSVIGGDNKKKSTLTIKFTATDKYAGDRDADTTTVAIHRNIDGEWTQQETVTLDAAQKESGLTYTTGEELALKISDSSDTSLCTLYKKVTVPYASWAEENDGSFQLTINTIDRGDTGYDALIQYHNGTSIADSATLDVTNESWDSDFAEIDFELRNTNDDSGYQNTYDFIHGYDNNHYVVLTASGTGWDSVNMIDSGGWKVYDKASTRYFVLPLDDTAIDRDKKGAGDYDPDGYLSESFTFDLTGFEAGDSVTLTYEYKYYSSWEHFKSRSTWGTNSASNPAQESVTIQY